MSKVFAKYATPWRSIPQSNARARCDTTLDGHAQATSSVAGSAPSSTVSPSVTCISTTWPAPGLGMSSAVATRAAVFPALGALRHPDGECRHSIFSGEALAFQARVRIMRGSDSAPVAQLDRVLGYEPRGRAFESLRAHHKKKQTGQSFDWPFCFSGEFLGCAS